MWACWKANENVKRRRRWKTITMDLFVCVEVSFLFPIDFAQKYKKSMCECGAKMRVRHRKNDLQRPSWLFFDASFDMTSWCLSSDSFVSIFVLAPSAHDFLHCLAKVNVPIVNVPMWNWNEKFNVYKYWIASSIAIAFHRHRCLTWRFCCLSSDSNVSIFILAPLPHWLFTYVLENQCANVELKWQFDMYKYWFAPSVVIVFHRRHRLTWHFLFVVWFCRFHLYFGSTFAHWLLHFL